MSDVMVPEQILTAVFFALAGDPPPSLTPSSAVLGEGSVVTNYCGVAGCPPPGNSVVGGEWAYKAGLAGAPLGATQGISSAGFNDLFVADDRFQGANLQGPDAPDGMQFGITSAGDNPTTGNSPVRGANGLIQSSVLFTLSVPAGVTLGDISAVSFQYGTSLAESNLPGQTPVPEPATFLLWGTVAAGLGFLRRRCRRARR
jgi:hypothetical protein